MIIKNKKIIFILVLVGIFFLRVAYVNFFNKNEVENIYVPFKKEVKFYGEKYKVMGFKSLTNKEKKIFIKQLGKNKDFVDYKDTKIIAIKMYSSNEEIFNKNNLDDGELQIIMNKSLARSIYYTEMTNNKNIRWIYFTVRPKNISEYKDVDSIKISNGEMSTDAIFLKYTEFKGFIINNKHRKKLVFEVKI